MNLSRIPTQQDLAKCPPPFPFSSFLSYQISVHFLFLLLCRDFFIASSPKNREKERSLKVLEKKNPIFLFLHTFSSEFGAERDKDGLYSSPGTPLICTKAPPSSKSKTLLQNPKGDYTCFPHEMKR